MNKITVFIVVILAAIFTIAGGYYLVNKQAEREVVRQDQEMRVLPTVLTDILSAEGINEMEHRPQDLQWRTAVDEEVVTVSLSAESYILGLMKKGDYDSLVEKIMSATTPEINNDADGATAGQRGFRAEGRPCIIGFAFTNVSESENAPVEVLTDDVYAIVQCSHN